MNYTEKVQEFIIDELMFGDRDKLTDTISFYSTGIIDSTGILELIAFIEETFDIKIEDDELIPENFDNLSCIGQFLERKLNGKNSKLK